MDSIILNNFIKYIPSELFESNNFESDNTVAAIKTFLQTIASTAKTCDMFQSGDAVLIGVSGGPDSVALLYALQHLSDRFGLRLGIAHLNHCLRRAHSDRDEDFVAALAQKLNLPCFIERCDVNACRRQLKMSLEEAARVARFAFLEKIAARNHYDKIALGHHADDNAELILMCLLRGSGPLGLSGMRPVREGKIVRPLLRTSRSDILHFLKREKAAYVLDESNDDPSFTRNRIRGQLMPELKQNYNPRIVDALNRLGMIAEAEEAWIGEMITPLFEKGVLFHSGEKLILSLPQLKKQPLAVQRRLLRKALKVLKGDLRRITLDHIDAVIGGFGDASEGKRLTLPQGVRVCFEPERLCFIKEPEEVGRRRKVRSSHLLTGAFEYRIDREQFDPILFDCYLHEIGMKVRFLKSKPISMDMMREAGQEHAFFDMNKIEFPLILRNFRPGDRFTPLGMTGHQKVKRFFINCKVPRNQRMQCPLLLSRNKIIWIAGYQIDDAVKVTSSTRDVLEVELLVAEDGKDA